MSVCFVCVCVFTSAHLKCSLSTGRMIQAVRTATARVIWGTGVIRGEVTDLETTQKEPSPIACQSVITEKSRFAEYLGMFGGCLVVVWWLFGGCLAIMW